MTDISGIIRGHPFFQSLDPSFSDLVCGCARNARFDAGSYLCREGEPADSLYLIREGQVALEIHAPAAEPLRFQTLDSGDLVGLSWLIPPYRWTYDARALGRTRVIQMDARCLRDRCEADHDLGYAVFKQLLPILVSRLQATRLQLLDIYGAPA